MKQMIEHQKPRITAETIDAARKDYEAVYRQSFAASSRQWAPLMDRVDVPPGGAAMREYHIYQSIQPEWILGLGKAGLAPLCFKAMGTMAAQHPWSAALDRARVGDLERVVPPSHFTGNAASKYEQAESLLVSRGATYVARWGWGERCILVGCSPTLRPIRYYLRGQLDRLDTLSEITPEALAYWEETLDHPGDSFLEHTKRTGSTPFAHGVMLGTKTHIATELRPETGMFVLYDGRDDAAATT